MTYDAGREVLEEFGFTAHLKARGEEATELKQAAGKRARRWVVERSQSWMNRFRRIPVRWDKKAENDLFYLGSHLVSCCRVIRVGSKNRPRGVRIGGNCPRMAELALQALRLHAVALLTARRIRQQEQNLEVCENLIIFGLTTNPKPNDLVVVTNA